MAKILVSVPVLGRPHLRMMQSLYSAINACKEHDISIFYSENDSMISRVRNVHLSTFIHDYSDYEYFISIDSDIEIVNHFQTNNIFSKLVAHDLPFVGGLYSLKRDDETICSSLAMDRIKKPQFNNGLKNMLWLSSGCWCLKRSMVNQMISKYPELTYDGDDNMSGKKVYGLYIPILKQMISEGHEYTKYLSEDWSFCSRWRDMGGQIFADTSIVLNHFGEKKYSLWNVEVMVKQREPNDKLLVNDNIKSDIFQSCDKCSSPIELPEAGFDL